MDPKHSTQGLSQEFIKEEILKCADSSKDNPAAGCIYFLEHYGYIRTETEGIVQFKLFDYQKEVIEELIKNKYLAILKSRQVGISTVISGFISWYILFRKQRHIFIMATKREKASISFEMVKTFINECPNWLKLFKIVKNNSYIFKLSNDSWVKASATSPDVGRGEAASLFFIDEAALIDKLNEHWSGLFPTISTGGKCVLASTPKGVGNKFWDICTSAKKGLNEFKVLDYPWSRRFSKEWFEKEKVGRNVRELAQEYECKFLESGDTFLDNESLTYLSETVKEPIKKERDMWIWRSPEFGDKYIIGADVARGDSGDNSSMIVMNVDTNEIVAEYSGKLKTNDFGEYLLNTAKKYNNALIVPEANTYGDAVIQYLIVNHYDNIYFHIGENFVEFWNAQTFQGKAKAGFSTTLKTRPIILQKIEEAVRLKKLVSHSQRLYDEFCTFIWKGDRPEAIRGQNDDLVMALAIAWYVREKAFEAATRLCTKTEMLASAFMTNKTSLVSAMTNGHEQNVASEIENLAMMISRH